MRTWGSSKGWRFVSGPAGRAAGMRASRVAGAAAAFTAALLMAGVAVACAGCAVETGDIQELVIDQPLGAASLTDVDIEMGAGSLSIKPGATGLASGVIRCNVESWMPTVERTENELTIKQQAAKSVSGLQSSIVNDWAIQLGPAPMRLHIAAGAYEGSFDLSGLTLEELTVKDGAARTEVAFNAVNPSQMSRLLYETGASTVTMTGLSNANFKGMTFKGGAGTYTLDFSGQLRTDAAVNIECGAGTVKIVVPPGTAARVSITGSLNSVSTEGVWTVNGDTYNTTAVGTQFQGRLLAITVRMDVGTVVLINR